MGKPDYVIVVVVEGGNVQDVLSVPSNMSVIVKDYDNEGHTDGDGASCSIAVYGESLSPEEIAEHANVTQDEGTPAHD